MNRELRARLLVEEARALGLAVDDLVAAATGGAKPITVAGWIDEIEPAFSPSTAATYGPYWRLAAHLLGDRYIAELTTTDLAGVVDAAAERARAHRPESTGRASRETWIAALRSLCARAVDAGHLITNRPLRSGSHTAQPAGAAPSTTASSPTLPTPSGPPAPTPTSTCCSSASTSRPAPAAKAPSTSVSETSIPSGPRSGSERRTTPNANNRSRSRSSRSFSSTPAIAEATVPAMPCSGTDEASRSAGAARPAVRPGPRLPGLGRPDPGVGSRASPHRCHPHRTDRRLSSGAGLRWPCAAHRDGPLPPRQPRRCRHGCGRPHRRNAPACPPRPTQPPGQLHRPQTMTHLRGHDAVILGTVTPPGSPRLPPVGGHFSRVMAPRVRWHHSVVRRAYLRQKSRCVTPLGLGTDSRW